MVKFKKFFYWSFQICNNLIIKYLFLANSGKLEWIGNWISFIDTMLQFSILGLKVKELYLPTRMQRVIIDPAKHLECIESLPENSRKFLIKYIIMFLFMR